MLLVKQLAFKQRRAEMGQIIRAHNAARLTGTKLGRAHDYALIAHFSRICDFRRLIKAGIFHADRREYKLVKRIRKALPVCPCHGHAKYAVAAPSAR